MRGVHALGAVVGYAADAVLGDPAHGHPVAGFGRAAGALEQRMWRDHRGTGAVYTAVCVGGVAALAAAAVRAAARPSRAAGPHPAGPAVSGPAAVGTAAAGAQVALAAAATWTVLGGASLVREARAIGALLRDGDLPGARDRLPSLCGRDPRGLDEAELARAVVESVAENTADAVVNALVWGALAGTPGLLAFRAVNTLDAMVGHRSPRYLRFGWASARLDDVAGWPGARLTAALTVLAATLPPTADAASPHSPATPPAGPGPQTPAAATTPGGRAARALRVWRRDAGSHPSPNAGQAEAAFAGALGVRLGGTLRYGARVEHRPVLGAELPAPAVADIERACRLSRRVGLLALAVTCAASLAREATGTARAAGSARAAAGSVPGVRR